MKAAIQVSDLTATLPELGQPYPSGLLGLAAVQQAGWGVRQKQSADEDHNRKDASQSKCQPPAPVDGVDWACTQSVSLGCQGQLDPTTSWASGSAASWGARQSR